MARPLLLWFPVNIKNVLLVIFFMSTDGLMVSDVFSEEKSDFYIPMPTTPRNPKGFENVELIKI